MSPSDKSRLQSVLTGSDQKVAILNFHTLSKQTRTAERALETLQMKLSAARALISGR